MSEEKDHPEREPSYDEVCAFAHTLRVRLDATEKERDIYRRNLELTRKKLKATLKYVTQVDTLGLHLKDCPKCMELQPCEGATAISNEVTSARKNMRDLLDRKEEP